MTGQVRAHFTLHTDGPELFLACSCGWSTRYADGVIFGQVGHDATTHSRDLSHRVALPPPNPLLGATVDDEPAVPLV